MCLSNDFEGWRGCCCMGHFDLESWSLGLGLVLFSEGRNWSIL